MILIPTHLFGKETTVQDLAIEMSGWALAGAGVHTWANGLRKRPLLNSRILFIVVPLDGKVILNTTIDPQFHLLWAVAGAGLGYAVHYAQKHALKKLERERDALVRRRMKRLERTISS